MSSGGSGSTTTGYRYSMGLHFGLCRGPVDELVEINVGGKKAWNTGEDQSSATESGKWTIHNDDLFGGDKKEGGIDGDMWVMMGEPTQTVPDKIKGWLGGRVPSFRGVVTVFFDGLVSAMNPYPKTWKFRVRRWSKGWDGDVWNPDDALIELYDSDSNLIRAMNPAHIIYECSTNRSWGRGLPRTAIDEISFRETAATLKAEQFGLCMSWNRTGELTDFMGEVISTIGASLYTDRNSGLLTLRLIRSDYTLDTLTKFDKSSGLLSIDVDDTSTSDALINEVIVTYQNPVDNTQHSVRVHNLASVQANGGAINSTKTDYSGIPTQDLATRVAQRDLRAQGSLLKRYTVTLDRRAWRVYPGAVFAVSDPTRNIDGLILRAGKCSDGGLTEGTITVEAVVDVFGLSLAGFVGNQSSAWVKPDYSLIPPTNKLVTEASYRDYLINGYVPSGDDVGGIAALAGRTSALAYGYDVLSSVGTGTYQDRGQTPWAPTAVTTVDLLPYAESLSYTDESDFDDIAAGMALYLEDEIVRIDGFDLEAKTLNISRGCLDTLPKAHPAGSRMFAVDNFLGGDGINYSIGSTVNVKLQTRATSATLGSGVATADSVLITGRQAEPYPPAQIKIGTELAFDVTSVEGPLKMTWVHRNRLTQDDKLISHMEDNIAPEDETTYTVKLLSGTYRMYERPGLTGNNLSVSYWKDDPALTVQLWSSRGTLESWQKLDTTIDYEGVGIKSVPFPGRRLGIVGDSISWMNNSYNALGALYYSFGMAGYVNYAMEILKWPLMLEPAIQPDPSLVGSHNGYNFAIAGSRTTQWWMPAFDPIGDGVMQRGPMHSAMSYIDKLDVIVMLGGTNDVAGNIPLLEIMANLKAVALTWSSLGKWVFIMTPTPRTASLLDGYTFDEIDMLQQRLKDIVQGLRDWINDENPPNIWLVDVFDLLVGANGTDPHGSLSNTEVPAGDDTVGTNWRTDGTPKVIFFGDGLHPSPAGAFVMGKQLAQVMQTAGVPLITSTPAWPYTRGANLLSNPTFTGSDGYKTGGSGVIPTEWLVFRSSNSDGTYSNFNGYVWPTFLDTYPEVEGWYDDSTWEDSALSVAPVTLTDGRRGLKLTFSTAVTGNHNESIKVAIRVPNRPAEWNGWDQTLLDTALPYANGSYIEAGGELQFENIKNLWTCEIQLDMMSINQDDTDTYSAAISGIANGQNFWPPNLIAWLKYNPEVTTLNLKTPIVKAPVPKTGETEQYAQFNLNISFDAGDDSASGTITLIEPFVRNVIVPDADSSTIGKTSMKWLTTDGNKLMDSNGRQVRLKAINWYGFESAFVAFGLWARPYKTITIDGTVNEGIIDQIKRLGFNCIRLTVCEDVTWGNYPVTDTSQWNYTYIDYTKNPDLFTSESYSAPQAFITSIEILDKFVTYCGAKNIRIILDMHCLAPNNDNSVATGGLWYTTANPGDPGETASVKGELRNEQQWLDAWAFYADRYKDTPTVCGFDLVNEPFNGTWGDGVINTDMQLAYQRAAAVIHAINPNLLIICEGIQGLVDFPAPTGTTGTVWSGKLDLVRDHPVVTPTVNKVVYSPHEYGSFFPGYTGNAHAWFDDPAYPANMPTIWRTEWGYLAEEGIAPIFIGEVGSWLKVGSNGYTQSNLDNDNDWLISLADYCRSYNINFAWWALNPGGEPDGYLDTDWISLLAYKTPYIKNLISDTKPPSISIEDLTVAAPTPQPITPLSTSGSDIVDAGGAKYRLTGVSWTGLESATLVPAGTYDYPYKTITVSGVEHIGILDRMAAQGFNCLKLAICEDACWTGVKPQNWINPNMNPDFVIAGASDYNDPSNRQDCVVIIDKIIDYCATLGMRVVLEMRSAAPTYDVYSGFNGRWYTTTTPTSDSNPSTWTHTSDDKRNEADWINSWKNLATRYNGNYTVIGADLVYQPYNCTWGDGSALNDVQAAYVRCANAIHAINDDWLIFCEGINGSVNVGGDVGYLYVGNNQNLTGVETAPVTLNVPNKVVYSPHEYSNAFASTAYIDSTSWPSIMPSIWNTLYGYIVKEGLAPVWIGELGAVLVEGATGASDVLSADDVSKESRWLSALMDYAEGKTTTDGTPDTPSGSLGLSWSWFSWNLNGYNGSDVSTIDNTNLLMNTWDIVDTTLLDTIKSHLSAKIDGKSTSVQVTVDLDFEYGSAVTVEWATADGTALAGTHYQAANGTLTFASGETSKTISIMIFGGGTGSKDFTVNLNSPGNALIGDGSATITINY